MSQAKRLLSLGLENRFLASIILRIFDPAISTFQKKCITKFDDKAASGYFVDSINEQNGYKV